jgi:SAM-dependent methyltransferase
MNAQAHWEEIYRSKAPDAVSWYRPHLDSSLALIERFAPSRSASIIDVGGGESTLVDDLIARGYGDVTVLDISETAIQYTRRRLGENANRPAWLLGDITETALPLARYDVWHDRAVFHFLTEPRQRLDYVRKVVWSVKPGGHVVIGTFGLHGPDTCSGLGVMRYDAGSLHGEFGPRFRLIQSSEEQHRTPFGTTQQFVHCYCTVI